MKGLIDSELDKINSNIKQISDHMEKMNAHLIEVIEEQRTQSEIIRIDYELMNNTDKLNNIKEENKQLSLRISEYKNEIKKTERKYKLSLVDKNKYDRVYEMIINSKSWRYTKPLRYFKVILQRK